jgi:cytoskeletal protein CcmA (bactofilin family)
LSLFSGKRGEREAGESAARSPVPAMPAPRESASFRQPTSQGETNVANIGKSISIRGDLTGNEDMVIEGKVEGKVDLPNNQLTVGADGSVKAEIHAKSVVIVGHVIGNVSGLERVELQATGRLEGDVTSPKLIVAEGAHLNGAILMGQPAAKQASTTPATPADRPDVRKAG